MKIGSLFLFLLLSINGFAQNMNLRKVILKSDLIFESNYNLQSEIIRKNDYTKESYLRVLNKDAILKNKLSTIPEKLILREFTEGEDFYSDKCCVFPTIPAMRFPQTARQYNLFFVKKIGKEYRILLVLKDLKEYELKDYLKQITSLAGIEKIKNEKERFTKTLDWFLENGLLPNNDKDFTDYYKEKGISIQAAEYSENQYETALQQFKNGKEDLLPIVKEKYFDEVNDYFVKKMERILEKENPVYGDYYEFSNSFFKLTGKDLEFNSGDYILNESLTFDKFDAARKKSIMQYLLKVAKARKPKTSF